MTKKKFLKLGPEIAKRYLYQAIQALELGLGPRQGPGARPGDILRFSQGREDLSQFHESLDGILNRRLDLIEELNRIRHELLLSLGKEALEWDLLTPQPEGAELAHSPALAAPRYPGTEARAEVYLHNLRSPFNVGSVFRSADAAGFQRVILSPACPRPGNRRLERSAMGSQEWIDWKVMEEEDLGAYAKDEALELIALETGGEAIWEVELPKRIILVLGSEELGLPLRILSRLPRISIPMAGRKASLNVGVSFGVAAMQWSLQNRGDQASSRKG